MILINFEILNIGNNHRQKDLFKAIKEKRNENETLNKTLIAIENSDEEELLIMYQDKYNGHYQEGYVITEFFELLEE